MMALTRKLVATFSTGETLTRTTKIPTLSHAWRADVTLHATRIRGGWAVQEKRFVGSGFASGADRAEAAIRREYPADGKWGRYTIHSSEVVECREAGAS